MKKISKDKYLLYALELFIETPIIHLPKILNTDIIKSIFYY